MKPLIFTLFLNLTTFKMDCVAIKSLSYVEEYLALNGKKFSDYEEQLPTNNAAVYRISTGEIILLPNPLGSRSKCLLFANEGCFQECLQKDSFPVENDSKEIYEYDQKGQRKIHENINEYHEYLNNRLKLDYPSMDKNNMQEYYSNVLKIKNKERMDILALGAVMGELFRKELNGKWILEKWYGTYNPYYKPLIMHSNTNRIESPYDKLMKMIERKEKDASKFFFVLPMTPYLTLDVLKQGGKQIIELQ